VSPRFVITPLSIAHWEKLSELFATSAGVAGCWCMWPRLPRGAHVPDEQTNRQAMKDLLDSGESPGLLALAGERAVGWCAVGPRENYLQYEQTHDRRVCWAIACLYVDPLADHAAVSQYLVDAAVELARDNAAEVIEGPPPYWLPGDAAAIAKAADAFLACGFSEISPGARMPVLRLILRNEAIGRC